VSNVQIPNLPVAIALNGTEALEAVQSGTSVQTTVARIAQYSYAYYPGFYISQLPAASSVNSTDIFPVVQGSTGPNTGTAYKATVAQLFTSPTFTGTTTLGSNLANYLTITGAASGSSPVIAAAGSDANVGITLTPKGTGRTFTTRGVFQQSSQNPATFNGGVLQSFIQADQTLTGSVTSGANVYVNNFNLADAVNTTTGSGPGALNYFTVINSVVGGTGGRNAFFSTVALGGTTTNAANNLFYNAGSFDANASFNQGGTAAGGNFAKLVAFTGEASARAGATYLNSIEASEIGAGVRMGGSAGFVHVFRISPLGYDAARGGFWSYNGLVFGHGTASPTAEGLDAAIGFGAADGNAWPVARTGSLLEIQTPNGAPLNTVAWGADFARGTFDGGAWRSPGTRIDGFGNIGGVGVYGTALQTRSEIKAATAVVGSIAVTNGGAFEAIPALTISAPPGSGTTATATVASMNAARAFIDTQGSGYTNGDVLTVAGGTAGTTAQLTVTVSGGLITRIVVSRAGSYTVLPANPVSVTGGTGTGAKFYMQWGVNAVTVTGGGTNYPAFPPPFISCSGEKSIKALFAVTMTETQQALVLNTGAVTQVDSLSFGASGPRIVALSGVPPVILTLPRGTLYLRTDGGVGSTLYVSQGGGTWNAVAGV
jgi:hypothetical protein